MQNENCKKCGAAGSSYVLGAKPIKLPESTLISGWVRKAFQYTGWIPYFGTDNAPNTWEDLQQWKVLARLYNHPAWPAMLPVFNGNCENTIHEGPEGNMMFRAWHDSLHLEHSLSFKVQDEEAVGQLQCNALAFLGAPYAVIKAIEADVIGQVHYHAITGQYVENQKTFVEHCLQYGMKAILQDVAWGKRY